MCTGAVGLPHQSAKATAAVWVVPSEKRRVKVPAPEPSAVVPNRWTLVYAPATAGLIVNV